MTALDKKEIDSLIAAHKPGFCLERPFYDAPEVFQRDMDRLLSKRWLLVDHESRIPNVGDYFLFEIGVESIIVIRESEDNILAHFNVCRHRGSRVCYEPEGNKRTLTCPYHGWSYSKAGELRPPPLMAEGFDRSKFGLHPCHVRVFHGFIFLCLTDSAPPDFDAEYSDFSETLAFHGFKDAKIAARRQYPNECNWKLVVENYLECYHCAPAHKEYCSIHPQNQLLAMGAGPGSGSSDAVAAYQPYIDEWESRARALGHPITVVNHDEETLDMAQLARLPINDRGFQSETRTGAPACSIRMGSFKECDAGETVVSFNPIGYIMAMNDFAVVFRFTPRSATYTDVELIWLVHGDAEEGEDYQIEDLCWAWNVTIQQDKLITEANYAGIRSARYMPGPYSTQETRLETFISWYLRSIRD